MTDYTEQHVEELSPEEKEGIAVYNYVRGHRLHGALLSLLRRCMHGKVMAHLPPSLKHTVISFDHRKDPEETFELIVRTVAASIPPATAGAERLTTLPGVFLGSVKAFYLTKTEEITKGYDHFHTRLSNAMQGVSRLRPMGPKEREWREGFMKQTVFQAHEALTDITIRMILAEAQSAGLAVNVPSVLTMSIPMDVGSNSVEPGFKRRRQMFKGSRGPRANLPRAVLVTLRGWLFEHFAHPYPTDAEKKALCEQTGLNPEQVRNWFINARCRIWKPVMLEMQQAQDGIGDAEAKAAVGKAIHAAAAARLAAEDDDSDEDDAGGGGGADVAEDDDDDDDNDDHDDAADSAVEVMAAEPPKQRRRKGAAAGQ